MDTEDLLNEYCEERECEYLDRRYLVRDNGAILRLAREGGREAPLDNKWTFGKKREDKGYLFFTGNIAVHQVVCTAFHGPRPGPNYIVDHKDTNRCNNRPENLRWFTRLENLLNNDITRKRITLMFGSVEMFLKNIEKAKSMNIPQDFSWMRTVTKEEAEACKYRLEEWAAKDNPKPLTGKGLGGWVFSDKERAEAAEWFDNGGVLGDTPYEKQKKAIEEENRRHYEEEYGIKESLTPGALQWNWKTKARFLLCPGQDEERTLQAYLSKLTSGSAFTTNSYGGFSDVVEADYNPNKDAVYVLAKLRTSFPSFALCKITLQDGFFIHKHIGSFQQEIGGHKYFTLAMEGDWTGGRVFDDGCWHGHLE